MYTVMGATGKVGAAVAERLLADGEQVSLAVRDPRRAEALGLKGARLVSADYEDAVTLGAALAMGPAGAFIMLPPLSDPAPGYPEARARIDSLHQALRTSCPARIVVLSTIGADAQQPNLLEQLQLLERRLATLSCPVTFLRAAWFLDNAALDLAAARERAQIDSYLQPLERAIPMVAAADVGTLAAQLLRAPSAGQRVVEVEGPAPVAPQDIARVLSEAFAHPVEAVAVPRANWAEVFTAQGMRNPLPRMQMLDGFNAGWIRFTGADSQRCRGTTTLAQVIGQLTR